MIDAEHAHPSVAYLLLLWPWLGVESHRIMQSAGHYIECPHVPHVCSVHLGTYISDVALDLPNTFSRPSPMTEEGYGAGVTLGIVGTDQTEQCALARTVCSAQCPTLALMHSPMQILENGTRAVTYVYSFELQYLTPWLWIEMFAIEVAVGEM